MTGPFATAVSFDLLKVGHCQHPECMALRGGSRRAIDFPALVGLIKHPQHGLMLYDTGYSQHFTTATRRFPECLYRLVTPVTLPPEEELLAQLESRGIAAKDIDTIFISHFHADHIAGLNDFPQARFIATGAEYNHCEKSNRFNRLRRAYLRDLFPANFTDRLTLSEDRPFMSLPEEWLPFTEARDLLGDASMAGINLPGHTASQLGLAFRENGGDMIFLVGDACWKIEGLAENSKPSRLAYALFHSGSDYDKTFSHLVSLFNSLSPPFIIPSHCSTTWNRRAGNRSVFHD